MKFLKNLSFYTIINVFNSGVAFLLLPIVTKYLNPEENGVYSIYLICIPVVLTLVGLVSHGAAQVEYYKLEKEDFKKFLSSSLINSFFLFIVFLFITLVFQRELCKLLEIPPGYLWVIPMIAFFQTVHQIVLVIHQSSNDIVKYGKFSLGFTILNISLSILLVVLFKLNWLGLVAGITITYSLFFVFGIVYLYKSGFLHLQYTKKYALEHIKFGLPLIPHALGAIVVDLSDRIFIAKMMSVSEVGVYNVGYQIAKIIGLAETSFVLAYTPFLYQKLQEGTHEAHVKIVKLSYGFIAGLMGCVILLQLFIPLIFDIFINKSYWGAKQFVFWVSMGYFFSGLYKMFVGFIFYKKQTYILTYLAFLNAGLNIVFNYYFILIFGTIGAAYATALSFFITAVIIIFIAQRIYKMPWLNFKN